MFDRDSEEYQQSNAEAREIFQGKQWHAAAELISGYIDGPQPMEDIWADVLGELDWTQADARQEFETPEHAIGGRALKMENGMTIPVMKVTKDKVTVAPEYLVAPAQKFDINDLATGDLGKVEEIGKRAAEILLLEKNIRGLKLITSGITNEATGLYVVVKSEDSTDFISGTDTYVWQRELKDLLDDRIAEIQDETMGGQVSLVCRSITMNDIKRSGFDVSSVKAKELNGAKDPNTKDVLFQKGDILLIGRGAANLAKVQETQPSEKSDHYTVEFTFRQGHKWIKWADKGWNTGRINRVLVMDKTAGAAKVHMLTANDMVVLFDKFVKASTITNATIKVTTTLDANTHVAGAYTIDVDPTLRAAFITFETPLTPGTAYVVRVTGSLQDAGGTAFNAGDILTATVNG